jgi:predicted Rossmann fold flavoprotein
MNPGTPGAPRQIVVVGAGAAGTMAAIFAASAGAATRLLERTRDGGRKILISGGGRCNILPSRVVESRFVTDSSPNTLKKILRSWPHREQVAFFEQELQLPLKEEPEAAKLFPVSDKARDVRDGLIRLARARGATFEPGVTVTGLTPRPRGWRVTVESGYPIDCDAVVVATGGLSVPNTGSDGTGLLVLESLGHTLHPTYPALTPIKAAGSPLLALSGVSLTVTLTASDGVRAATARGGFLFTHRGYSGPAVLDVSHVLVRARQEGRPARLVVQWTDLDAAAWEERLRPVGNETIGSALRRELPDRLARELIVLLGLDPTTRLAQLKKDDRQRLIDSMTAHELPWTGDEGYQKAEVTGGGVSLAEIDPVTMESRLHPGLFICGEALDAFGPIGGYNFLWAWATGRAAGLGAATARQNS